MTTTPDEPTPEQWAAHKAANADEFGVYPPDRDGIQFQGNPGGWEIKGAEMRTLSSDDVLLLSSAAWLLDHPSKRVGR